MCSASILPSSSLPSDYCLKRAEADNICFSAIFTHCVSAAFESATSGDSLSVLLEEIAQIECLVHRRVDDEALACGWLLQCSKCDGQLWVQGEVGSDWRVGGCEESGWWIWEQQIDSAQTCWGAISPENSGLANHGHPLSPF